MLRPTNDDLDRCLSFMESLSDCSRVAEFTSSQKQDQLGNSLLSALSPAESSGRSGPVGSSTLDPCPSGISDTWSCLAERWKKPPNFGFSSVELGWALVASSGDVTRDLFCMRRIQYAAIATMMKRPTTLPMTMPAISPWESEFEFDLLASVVEVLVGAEDCVLWVELRTVELDVERGLDDVVLELFVEAAEDAVDPLVSTAPVPVLYLQVNGSLCV